MSEHQSETKLWGGRFTSAMEATVRAFNDSFAFDQRLAASDIAGSLAYAEALKGAGLLDEAECSEISSGLERIQGEFSTGAFLPLPADEDIHTAIERRLHELVGAVAGKLHT
ncbi:argininosuccinate lyase, partial [Candidatus Bipolaricaulota bacterium]|nr:argininosuccinate lyase [Candidatus Bipolaricaulota bacterium]